MLLVIAYSRDARRTLRNVCRAHEGTVVRQAGRVALLEETEFGAFQAVRLRAKHGTEVQVERTEPFNEFEALRDPVRQAAESYEQRGKEATPYDAFAAGRDLPTKTEMREREL